MKSWKLGVALLMATLLGGCGGKNTPPVGIVVSPISATVVLSGSQQFTASVTGSSNTSVNWSVNNVAGGNATVGKISSTGLYTAPATLPNPATVTVTAAAAAAPNVKADATVTLDSGIRVQVSPASATVGTGEIFTFSVSVTGTANTAVNWSVNTIAGGNSTFGTITPAGVYTAPTALPNPSSFKISATSAADPNQTGSASLMLLSAADPTLTSLDLDPGTAAQGSVFQDVHASGTNFFSTSTLRVNGTPIPTVFLSTTLLRGRIPGVLLAAAGPEPVDVQRQNGNTTAPLTLTVSAVRPALISSSPDSVPQGGGAASVNLTGGFYSPSTSAKFNGQIRAANLSTPRQLNVALTGSDLTSAGLFPLVVRNTGVPASSPGATAVNLAVEPPAAAVPSAPIATLSVGSQPFAVAINTATDTAVVVNRGDNTLSLINLATNTVGSAIPVGNQPTGVAVDDILNLGVVVNSGSNTLSLVDLGSGTVTSTISLPSGTTPFSVGVNSLSHRALVANASTNIAYVVDLSTSPPSFLCTLGGTNPPNSCLAGANTNPVSTGPTPAVAVEPRLNWAIVTPGGSGTTTIVDLGRPAAPGDAGRMPNPFATLTISASIQGISINTETEQALLTDPNSASLNLFSVLDQTVTTLVLDKGEVASAVNPLTNIGVAVNNLSNQATVVNLRTQLPIVTVGVGTNPQAVAIDPASNLAVVANRGSNNVSILSLGPLRPLHITQASPAITLASSSDLTLRIIGHGFVSGSVVRLDETPLPLANVTFVSDRQLVATVPGSMLGAPRRYFVDVENPDTTISNETDLTVIKAVGVGGSPQAVALDAEHNLAVVTNTGGNSISVVDLNAGTAGTPIGVGTSPQGVAVLPRLNLAVVTNNGSNNASIVDLSAGRVISTVTLPISSAPLGVAIHPDTGTVVVANSGVNSVGVFKLDSPQSLLTIPVDQRPVAVAIDPTRNIAAVAASTSGTLDLISLANNFFSGRVQGFQVPTGVSFDPVSGDFLAANSLQNNVDIVDPVALVVTPLRIGINPTSIDYNFQTSTLVTVNNASHTVSVMDFLGQRVRAVLDLDGSAGFSVAINPRTNIAVVVDQNNDRVLLVPLPR